MSGEPQDRGIEAETASGPASHVARRRLSRAFIAIMVVAAFFRGALASQMTAFHADEVWQYLEPAYGIVTGHWIHAWEFREGIRGWFVPAVLALPLALGHGIAPDSQLHIYLMRTTLGALSLAVPWAWYDLGRPISRLHGLVAAWVAAIWCEVFYFAVRPSAEGIVLSLLFPAIALARRVRLRPAPGPTACLGLLLALGFVVRFHYLPAMAVTALWALAPAPRRTIAPLLAGALTGLAIGGLCDMACGQAPLAWIWRSIAFNIMAGGSEQFGTMPPTWLTTFQIETWGWTALFLVPACLMGARRYPVLLALALIVFAMHSAIAHKEYRFVLLGTTSLILLAALGSVDILNLLFTRAPFADLHLSDGLRLSLLAALWLALSVTVALCNPFVAYWGQGDKQFTTLVLAGEQPGLCGLASFDAHNHPSMAMSYFNRDVPVLLFDGPQAREQALAMQTRFNVAIASTLTGESLPPGFRLVTCYRQASLPFEDRQNCIFIRPGECSGSVSDFAYQEAMERRGK